MLGQLPLDAKQCFGFLIEVLHEFLKSLGGFSVCEAYKKQIPFIGVYLYSDAVLKKSRRCL